MRAFDDGKMIYQSGALNNFQRFIRILNENAILMSAIGMKDKTGTEIYEGDIIELINDKGKTIHVTVEYGIVRRSILSYNKIVVIEVDIPSFYFKTTDGLKTFPIVDNYEGKHDSELFKIIGNIYENM